MKKGAQGFSLVEVLVASTIGVILILGVMEIFGSSRAAFSSAEGMSRVQENGRFAMDFVRRELRMVGHVGCLDERSYFSSAGEPAYYTHFVDPPTDATSAPFALRLDWPLIGYEFVGSAPGDAVDLSSGPVTVGGLGAFSPGVPAELGALAADAIRGSDIVVVRYLSGESVRTVDVDVASNQLRVNEPDDVDFFQARGIYGVSNCEKSSLFQALSAGATISVGTGGLNAVDWAADESVYAAGGSSVHQYNYAVLYVGLDPASGEPALRRRVLDIGDANLLSPPVTLVEGVESMQIVFGVDEGAVRDTVLDQYRVASDVESLDVDSVASWQRVVNARVAFLIRSPTRASALRDAASPALVGAGTTFVPADDQRMRQVYESVIALRNRTRN